MSTHYMPMRQILHLCKDLSLELEAVLGASPPEFRVFNECERGRPIFQGTEERVSDFLTGWSRGRREMLLDTDPRE